MRILIIGGSGYLGGALIRHAVSAGLDITATYCRTPGPAEVPWQPLDISDAEATAAVVAAVRPDAVVNAAYRKDDPSVTADGAGNVATAATAGGAHLVHVSTDVVFAGADEPYVESSEPDPITPYAAAKAAAEAVVRLAMLEAAVVRTSLILGDGRSPHEQAVHKLAAGEPGALYTNVIRCPVHLDDLAAALLELAEMRAAGVCHVAGTDALSRYELGVLIARRDGLDATALRASEQPYGGPCGPLDARLDCTATQARLRTLLRGAREFLA